MEENEVKEKKDRKDRRTSFKTTYLQKYEVLQNETLTMEDLSILLEKSLQGTRNTVKDDYKPKIEEHNKEHPDNQIFFKPKEKPMRISKKFVIEINNIDENYIFKKAKEELQLMKLKGDG